MVNCTRGDKKHPVYILLLHARIQKIFSVGVGGPNSQKGSDGKFQHGTGIFLPFQIRDPGPMILGKIIRISVKLGKWIQNRTGDNMHILC